MSLKKKELCDDNEQSCMCNHSRCIKLYCVCFSASRACSTACRCFNCQNYEGGQERDRAIKNTLYITPNAFKNTRVHCSDEHSKGCSCTRSDCLKRYCACYASGVFCGEDCTCKSCLNNQTAVECFECEGHLSDAVADIFLQTLTNDDISELLHKSCT